MGIREVPNRLVFCFALSGISPFGKNGQSGSYFEDRNWFAQNAFLSR